MGSFFFLNFLILFYFILFFYFLFCFVFFCFFCFLFFIHSCTGQYTAIQGYTQLYNYTGLLNVCDRNRFSIDVTIQFALDLFVPERRKIRRIKNEIKDQFVI